MLYSPKNRLKGGFSSSPGVSTMQCFLVCKTVERGRRGSIAVLPRPPERARGGSPEGPGGSPIGPPPLSLPRFGWRLLGSTRTSPHFLAISRDFLCSSRVLVPCYLQEGSRRLKKAQEVPRRCKKARECSRRHWY